MTSNKKIKNKKINNSEVQQFENIQEPLFLTVFDIRVYDIHRMQKMNNL